MSSLRIRWTSCCASSPRSSAASRAFSTARYAIGAQRALDQLASLCNSDPACRKTFPDWERRLGALVKAWNVQPVNGMTGDELASVVHGMLLDLRKAVSIPLVVSRAAEGEYALLERAGPGDLDADLDLVGSSISCNEPRAGLDATGPWGTVFNSLTDAHLFARLRLRLTAAAERTMAGDADRVKLFDVDRWVGGTHVTSRSPWRWDPARGDLLPPG